MYTNFKQNRNIESKEIETDKIPLPYITSYHDRSNPTRRGRWSEGYCLFGRVSLGDNLGITDATGINPSPE